MPPMWVRASDLDSQTGLLRPPPGAGRGGGPHPPPAIPIQPRGVTFDLLEGPEGPHLRPPLCWCSHPEMGLFSYAAKFMNWKSGGRFRHEVYVCFERAEWFALARQSEAWHNEVDRLGLDPEQIRGCPADIEGAARWGPNWRRLKLNAGPGHATMQAPGCDFMLWYRDYLRLLRIEELRQNVLPAPPGIQAGLRQAGPAFDNDDARSVASLARGDRQLRSRMKHYTDDQLSVLIPTDVQIELDEDTIRNAARNPFYAWDAVSEPGEVDDTLDDLVDFNEYFDLTFAKARAPGPANPNVRPIIYPAEGPIYLFLRTAAGADRCTPGDGRVTQWLGDLADNPTTPTRTAPPIVPIHSSPMSDGGPDRTPSPSRGAFSSGSSSQGGRSPTRASRPGRSDQSAGSGLNTVQFLRHATGGHHGDVYDPRTGRYGAPPLGYSGLDPDNSEMDSTDT